MVLSLDNNAIWYCTFLPFIVEENERSCDLWWFHVFSFFLYIFSVSIVAKVTIDLSVEFVFEFNQKFMKPFKRKSPQKRTIINYNTNQLQLNISAYLKNKLYNFISKRFQSYTLEQ